MSTDCCEEVDLHGPLFQALMSRENNIEELCLQHVDLASLFRTTYSSFIYRFLVDFRRPLRRLTISDFVVHGEKREFVVSFVAKLIARANVEELHMKDPSQVLWEGVTRGLLNNFTIQRLELSEILSGKPTADIARYVESSAKLKHLKLAVMDIGNLSDHCPVMQILGAVRRRRTKLKRLSLYQIPCTPDVAEIVHSILKTDPFVHLDWKFSSINHSRLKELMAGGSLSCLNLRVLNLHKNRLEGTRAQELLRKLLLQTPRLEHLNMACNPKFCQMRWRSHTNSPSPFMRALGRMNYLYCLNLSNTGMTQDALDMLSTVLSNHTSLRELYLGSNAFFDISSLTMDLESRRAPLHQLDLSSNKLLGGDHHEWGSRLGRLVQSCGIECLCLSSCRLRGQALAGLLCNLTIPDVNLQNESVFLSPILQSLKIEGNRMRATAIEMLKDTLPYLPVAKLHFSWNDNFQKWSETLQEALLCNPHLITVEVSGNTRLTDMGVVVADPSFARACKFTTQRNRYQPLFRKISTRNSSLPAPLAIWSRALAVTTKGERQNESVLYFCLRKILEPVLLSWGMEAATH